jgi:hypothetical protein
MSLTFFSFFNRRNITVYSAILSAYTIDHDKDKSTGPSLLVSFHGGNHYNSVHRNSARAPIKPMSRSLTERRPTRRSSRRSPSSRRSSATCRRSSSMSDTVTTSASTISTMEEYQSQSEPSINDGKEIPLATVVAVDDKPIERSAPCPCGSGRKYKKCCLVKLKNEAKLHKKKLKKGGYSTADTRQDDEESKIVMKGKFRVLRI